MSVMLAKQTIERVQAAFQEGRVTGLPELVKILRALSTDEDEVSVVELAELIQQDSAVLLKVVTAANTLGYNPFGYRIGNLSEAIQKIGFARVRRLALSLMLLEQASRGSSPMEQRELAARSLCSGLVAQALAKTVGVVDPEQAFVGASLKNFGRLLLGTFFTDDYRRALALAKKEGDDKAFRTVFGITPVDLGYELLRAAELPKPILSAIRDLPPGATGALDWADRRLAQVASFSLELAQAMLDPGPEGYRFTRKSVELVRRYSKDMPGLEDHFASIVAGAEEQFAHLARRLGAGALRQYGLDRVRQSARTLQINAPKAPPAPGGGCLRVGAAPSNEGLADADDLEEELALEDTNYGPPAPEWFLEPEFTPAHEEVRVVADEAGAGPPVPPAATEESTLASDLASALGGHSPDFDRRPTLHEALEELERAAEGKAYIADPLPYALSAMHRSLAPRDLLFCGHNERRGEYYSIYGRGPLHDALPTRCLFRSDERNIFFLCHARLENLVIRDAMDASIVKHLPIWLQRVEAPRAFVLVPAHRDGRVRGIMLLGWRHALPENFSTETVNQVRRLLELVAHG